MATWTQARSRNRLRQERQEIIEQCKARGASEDTIDYVLHGFEQQGIPYDEPFDFREDESNDAPGYMWTLLI